MDTSECSLNRSSRSLHNCCKEEALVVGGLYTDHTIKDCESVKEIQQATSSLCVLIGISLQVMLLRQAINTPP